MNLYLSRDSTWNTVLCDSEGKALYHIHTSNTLTQHTTKIARLSPDAGSKYAAELAEGKKVGKDWDLGGEELSRIYWHSLKSSRLIHHGAIYELKDFMPWENALHTSVSVSLQLRSPLTGSYILRRKRTFTAPDGRSYRWVTGTSTCYVSLLLQVSVLGARVFAHSRVARVK